MEETTYKVSGMTCGGCVNSVKNAVALTLPTAEVDVSLEQGTVSVRGDHNEAAVKQAIEDAGFAFGGTA